MNDEFNGRDDTTPDLQLRDFLRWRATVGPRPRGSAATTQAIAERLDTQRVQSGASRPFAYALGGAVVIALVLATAAFVFLRSNAQGPATQPSPTPSAACPPRGPFVPGTASADQLSELWAERIEGNIGSGAIVFPTPVHPNSAGQRELWFASGTLQSPRRIASLGTSDGEPEDGYDIRVDQISADTSAALVEVYVPVPEEDPQSVCDEWFVVSTSATEPRISRVAGVGDKVLEAALSPDGTRVAFVLYSRNDGVGNAHLEVRDLNGDSTVHTLITTAINTELAWSPDSDKVAVTSGMWAGVSNAVTNGWTFTRQMTGPDCEPTSLVWPSESGSPTAACAAWNETNDGFVGFTVVTIEDTGHQFLPTYGDGEGPWTPRAELSPDGTHLRSEHFVAGDYVNVTIDLTSTSPSLINLNSDFDTSYPLVTWQWSRDSRAIEQSAVTDRGGQIVSVPIDGASPETTLVTLTTLWGDNHDFAIGAAAWIGP
jgi:hypothetical protein